MSQEPGTSGRAQALVIRGLFAILCLVAAAGLARDRLRAEAPQVPWEERFEIRTEHFHVQCNVSSEQTARYARVLETIHARLTEVFSSPPVRGLRRTPVYIHASRSEFLELAPLARGHVPAITGYYRPGDGSITTYHEDSGFTVTTFGVLCHESTHCYQELVLGDLTRVPAWLLEGLAIYMAEGSSLGPERGRLSVGRVPRRRLAHIQEAMLSGRHLPVERLTRREWEGGHLPARHHADAWALVYFLVNSGESGERLLNDYWGVGLHRRVRDEDLARLAKKHFGSVAEMERQYTSYVLGLELPPAGTVHRGRFVSRTFGFRLESPGERWVFFDDPTDRQMLTGLRLPGSSAEIRIRLEDNPYGEEGETGLRHYLRQFTAANSEMPRRATVISGRQGFQLTNPTRSAVKYVIIEVDGIFTIDCRAPGKDIGKNIGKDTERWERVFASVPDCLTFLPRHGP